MASVACQLIEEVTAHGQSDSLEDAREICADGTYFPNNLCIKLYFPKFKCTTHQPISLDGFGRRVKSCKTFDIVSTKSVFLKFRFVWRGCLQPGSPHSPLGRTPAPTAILPTFF